MSEKIFSKFMRGGLKGKGVHVSMIESPETCPGHPDLSFCFNGRKGEIELKYGDSKHTPYVRPKQVIWFRKEIAAGGRPFFLLHDGDTDRVYLVPGSRAPKIKGSAPVTEWASQASTGWQIDGCIDGLINHIKNMKWCMR